MGPRHNAVFGTLNSSLYQTELDGIKKLISDVLEEVKPPRHAEGLRFYGLNQDQKDEHYSKSGQGYIYGHDQAIDDMEAKQRELGL